MILHIIRPYFVNNYIKFSQRNYKQKLSYSDIEDMNIFKPLRTSLVVGLMLISCSAFAKEKEIVYQPYELDTLIHNINKPEGPVVTNDFIVFTAEPNNRNVGIAFDFEEYKVIHPFQLLTSTDIDGNKESKHLFYCYKREHKYTKIKYRMIIDGLWTTDPLNGNKEYDDDVNLYFSYVVTPESINRFTEAKKTEGVHFIYKGEKGLKLHLAGTFTNWDPWIYELTETAPGFYELSLPLPKGKYFYNYYIGLSPIVDNTNPNKVYTSDGRTASVLVVD